MVLSPSSPSHNFLVVSSSIHALRAGSVHHSVWQASSAFRAWRAAADRSPTYSPCRILLISNCSVPERTITAGTMRHIFMVLQAMIGLFAAKASHRRAMVRLACNGWCNRSANCHLVLNIELCTGCAWRRIHYGVLYFASSHSSCSCYLSSSTAFPAAYSKQFGILAVTLAVTVNALDEVLVTCIEVCGNAIYYRLSTTFGCAIRSFYSGLLMAAEFQRRVHAGMSMAERLSNARCPCELPRRDSTIWLRRRRTLKYHAPISELSCSCDSVPCETDKPSAFYHCDLLCR